MPPVPWPEVPAKLRLHPLLDEVVETHGFTPMSSYVEFCWLPVLGPTSTWLYRRVGPLVIAGIKEVDTLELAATLGLSTGLSRHAALARAIQRLHRFGVVRYDGEGVVVRRALGPLSMARLSELPQSVRNAHHRLTNRVAS